MAIQSRDLTSTQVARLEKARAVTEAQISMAIEIAGMHGEAGLNVLGAIIQALATNYAASADAAK
jgi:hypothetical protein